MSNKLVQGGVVIPPPDRHRGGVRDAGARGDIAAGRQASRLTALVVLGAASYAVYLVHNPVPSLAVRVVKAVMPDIGVWAGFGLIALVAAIAGLLYWRWFERPMLEWTRTRLARSRARLNLAVAQQTRDP